MCSTRRRYRGIPSCTSSSTSTNHSALALGAKEAYWLAQLFQEIDPSPPKPLLPVPVYGDSSGVIALVFNPVEHQANKHIRVADHFARELTKEGVIAPHRVASELNKADPFTKPLQASNFKKAAGWLVGDGIKTESVFMFSTTESAAAGERPVPVLACRRSFTASTPSSIQFQCLHCSSCEFQWTCTCSKPPRPMTPDGDRLCPRPRNAWLEEMSAKLEGLRPPPFHTVQFHTRPSMRPSFSANGCESLREDELDEKHVDEPVPPQVDEALGRHLVDPPMPPLIDDALGGHLVNPPLQRARRRRYDEIEKPKRSSERKKAPPQRSYSTVVAFTGPCNRRSVFHAASCTFVTAGRNRKWKYCTNSQANGHGMRPASECQYACLDSSQE